MLVTGFAAVVNMSITASVVIAVVLLARLALKGAPKRFAYALWAVVLFRLLCPVALPSPVSLLQTLGSPAAEAGRMEYVSLEREPMETTIQTISDFHAPEAATEPAAPPADDARDTVSVTALSRLWILGAVILAAFQGVQLLRLRRRLIGAAHLQENIYLADHIPAPFVLGLVRPKIYLPSALTEAERPYILLHEQHHIRRGDHVFKLLALIALCLHWFNPLVWLSFVLSSRDMELSCDEAVLRRAGEDIRAAYCTSLLRCSGGQSMALIAPLAFGARAARARIRSVMRYRKPSRWSVAASILACLCLTACLASNPEPVEQAADAVTATLTDGTTSPQTAPPEDVSFDDGTTSPQTAPPENVSFDCTMNDQDFAAYCESPLGSVMAEPDYADGTTLVFHYLNGLFVYDLQSRSMRCKLDLHKLDIAPHGQGDTVLFVRVSRDGQTAYLSSTGASAADFREYVVDLRSGAASEGVMPEDAALFTDYVDLNAAALPDGWSSVRGVSDGRNAVSGRDRRRAPAGRRARGCRQRRGDLRHLPGFDCPDASGDAEGGHGGLFPLLRGGGLRDHEDLLHPKLRRELFPRRGCQRHGLGLADGAGRRDAGRGVGLPPRRGGNGDEPEVRLVSHHPYGLLCGTGAGGRRVANHRFPYRKTRPARCLNVKLRKITYEEAEASEPMLPPL